MSILIPANSAVSGGYTVANSLMFDKASNPYLTRTNGGNGSETKGTYSVWLKRAVLDGASDYMWHTSEDTNNDIKILTNSDNNFRVRGINNGSVVVNLISDREFEDVAAWYHLVVAFDSTQGTAANRVKMYINGVQETSFSSATYPSQNLNLKINQSGDRRTIGTAYDNGGSPVSGPNAGWSGYMAEAVWIDGTALAPTSFGEFDEDSGIWKPIDVSGLTFGTNGFYLDFEDSSALGNDAAGSNNFSVSGIAATDQGTDTCTNNFPTFNILAPSASGLDIREGNTFVFNDDNNNVWQTVPATMIITPTAKIYWEINCVNVWGSGSCEMHGIADLDNMIQTMSGQASDNATSFAWRNDASFRTNGSTISGTTWAVSYTTGDFLMFALDNANGALYAGKNGTWLNSGNPESGSSKTGALSVTAGLNYAPHSELKYGSDKPMYNFGSPYYAISSGNADGDGIGNFEYAVPSGYFALCTTNLAEYG